MSDKDYEREAADVYELTQAAMRAIGTATGIGGLRPTMQTALLTSIASCALASVHMASRKTQPLDELMTIVRAGVELWEGILESAVNSALKSQSGLDRLIDSVQRAARDMAGKP
jgi:hypothetical protein